MEDCSGLPKSLIECILAATAGSIVPIVPCGVCAPSLVAATIHGSLDSLFLSRDHGSMAKSLITSNPGRGSILREIAPSLIGATESIRDSPGNISRPFTEMAVFESSAEPSRNVRDPS